MTNNLEQEIRAVLASMDNQESQEQEREAQTSPEQIEDIYVLILREHGEAEEDQPQVVESEPVKPPDKPPQPFPYLMLGIVLICSIPMLASIMLQVYLFQNPPIATITIIPKSQHVTLSGTLQIGRVLQPITISQSATTATTGQGHQDARAATGTVTFFNGLFTQQFVASGTVYTGQDGVEIVTTEDATIPKGDPSSGYGTLTVTAQAIQAGSTGNIQPGDINITINNGLLVKNNQFQGGQDERNFQTVAKNDIDITAATLKPTLIQSMSGAFQGQLKQSEQLYILPCNPTVTSDHRVGDEAIQVKVTVSETCSAVAYDIQALETRASALLTSKAQANLAGYSLFGDIQIKVNQASVSRTNTTTVFLSFQATGTWIYGLSRQSQEQIKKMIAGKPKDQAVKIIASMPGIERASLSWGDDTKLPKDRNNIHVVMLVQMV